MTNLKTPSAGRLRLTMTRSVLLFLFLTAAACGYQAGGGGAHVNDVGPAGGRTIAIPLFENVTFEPILEKRVTETFKETFYSRGWKIVSDQNMASFVLTGTINRFERIPVSLNREGQAEQFRVKIGMELRLLDSENRQKRDGEPDLLKKASEGVADYIARADVAADRVAEDRAIREAGRKMAEQVTDLLTARNFYKPEPGPQIPPQPASPAAAP